MHTKEYVQQLISSLKEITTSQKKFLVEIIFVLFAMRGRTNFTNMARYTTYNERTIRRNYDKSVNFVALNLAPIHSVNATDLVGVFDCSFVPKSGKQTYGLDNFWSGCDNKASPDWKFPLWAVLIRNVSNPGHLMSSKRQRT